MKRLKQFLMSCMIDDPGRMPAWVRGWLEGDSGTRSFGAASARLEQQLRTERVAEPAPAELHQSILRAVRIAGQARPEPEPTWALKLAAPALALVLTCGLWLNARVENSPGGLSRRAAPALVAGPAALELGSRLADASPALVMSPLADEWQRLNRDLELAAARVLSTLP